MLILQGTCASLKSILSSKLVNAKEAGGHARSAQGRRVRALRAFLVGTRHYGLGISVL